MYIAQIYAPCTIHSCDTGSAPAGEGGRKEGRNMYKHRGRHGKGVDCKTTRREETASKRETEKFD